MAERGQREEVHEECRKKSQRWLMQGAVKAQSDGKKATFQFTKKKSGAKNDREKHTSKGTENAPNRKKVAKKVENAEKRRGIACQEHCRFEGVDKTDGRNV